MKLPYQLGAWYAMPLGDGSYAHAAIVRAHHHVVDVAAYVEGHDAPVAVLRVSDRALVLHRWHRTQPIATLAGQKPENAAWIAAALAERIVAARLARLPFAEERCLVQDLRSGDVPYGSILTWRKALDAPTLKRVAAHIEKLPRTAVRLYGEAMEQLSAFQSIPLKRLRITGPVRDLKFESVEELHIEASLNLDDALRAFPNLRSLRIAARGLDVVAAKLPRELRALDCSGVRSVELDGAPPLVALRLARVERSVDLRSAPQRLRILALEDVRVHALEKLAGMGALEQLEVHGMWHLDIADLEPLLRHPGLLRATVDIGGRRKNVELYKRARWAYPWPFAASVEALSATAEVE